MAVPGFIKNLANKVRKEIYGKDVRESIAQSMEVSGETADDAQKRSVEQLNRVDRLIRENPQPSEIVDARGEYPILRDRLNSTDSQLAQTDQKIDENTTDYNSLTKANEGGVIDNHELLLEKIEYAKEHGKGLYIPNGKYFISDDVFIEGIDNILIDGELVFAEGKKLELVGARGQFSSQIQIRKVTGKIRLAGFYNSKMSFMGVSELELYANGDMDYVYNAMAYNEITLGRIENFRIFSEGDEIGWINENTFYGGRFIESIYIGGNYHHNNNIFYQPKIEHCEVNIDRGSFNRFRDVRLEGNNEITFGTLAQGNIIYRSWRGTSDYRAYDAAITADYPYTDNGVGNDVMSEAMLTLNQQEVFRITNKSHRLEDFLLRNNAQLECLDNYTTVYESPLYPIDTSLAINLKSDARLWRLNIMLYDANRNQIRDDESIGTDNYTFFPINRFYGVPVNTHRTSATIMKKPNASAKYFSFQIQNGDETVGSRFKQLIVNVVCKKNEYLYYIVDDAEEVRKLTKNRRPTETNYPRGTQIFHGSPLAGRDVSWIYDGIGNWLKTGTLEGEQ